jgi:hypothetical protein
MPSVGLRILSFPKSYDPHVIQQTPLEVLLGTDTPTGASALSDPFNEALSFIDSDEHLGE